MKTISLLYLLRGERADTVRCVAKRRTRFEISRGNAKTNTRRNPPCTRLGNGHELLRPSLNEKFCHPLRQLVFYQFGFSTNSTCTKKQFWAGIVSHSKVPRNSCREILPSFPMTNLQSPTTVEVIPWQNSHSLIRALIRTLARRCFIDELRWNNYFTCKESCKSGEGVGVCGGL